MATKDGQDPATLGSMTSGHGTPAEDEREPSHREIAQLAHQYWLERNGSVGNAEDDWFRAVEELRARRRTRNTTTDKIVPIDRGS